MIAASIDVHVTTLDNACSYMYVHTCTYIMVYNVCATGYGADESSARHEPAQVCV